MIETVGLVVRNGIDEALKLGKKFIGYASERGYNVVLSKRNSNLAQGRYPFMDNRELVSRADLIVTLGGDGTLIHVARFINSNDGPLLLGVNFGKLGFLTEVPPSELFSVFDSVTAGSAKVGHRSLLYARVYEKEDQIASGKCVNDAVILKGAREKLIDIDIKIDGEYLMRIRADGIIAATPTGSTAYSLSCGGSIVHPDSKVVLLTPICPHSLTNRPIILDSSSVVEFNMAIGSSEVYLILDGDEHIRLKDDYRILVGFSDVKLNFIRSPKKSYFAILREKLNWGISNENLLKEE